MTKRRATILICVLVASLCANIALLGILEYRAKQVDLAEIRHGTYIDDQSHINPTASRLFVLCAEPGTKGLLPNGDFYYYTPMETLKTGKYELESEKLCLLYETDGTFCGSVTLTSSETICAVFTDGTYWEFARYDDAAALPGN